MKNKILQSILLLIILFLLSGIITPILAQDDVPIPTGCISNDSGFCLNVPVGKIEKVSSFGEYIQIWYNFVVGAVGIMATVIIMWGGFKWLTSRGNSAAISDAKDRIWSAIIGLILVFLSYNILYLLNSDLLKVGIEPLPPVNITPISIANTDRNTSPGTTIETLTPPMEEIITSQLPEVMRFEYEYQPDDIELGQSWTFNEEIRFTPDGQGQYWASWEGMSDESIAQFVLASRGFDLPLTPTAIQTSDRLINVSTSDPDPLNPNSVTITYEGDRISGDIFGVRVLPPK